MGMLARFFANRDSVRQLRETLLIWALAATLLYTPALGQGIPGSSFAFAKFASITTTASTLTLPTSTTGATQILAIKVKAPSTNTDQIYVLQTGTADNTALRLAPGDGETVSCATKTISAISASGTQALEVIVYFR